MTNGQIECKMQEAFELLANRWESETAHISSFWQKRCHPYFGEIIALGLQVVPLCIARLEIGSIHWASLLGELVEDPPVIDDPGNIDSVRLAWNRWLNDEHS